MLILTDASERMLTLSKQVSIRSGRRLFICSAIILFVRSQILLNLIFFKKPMHLFDYLRTFSYLYLRLLCVLIQSQYFCLLSRSDIRVLVHLSRKNLRFS